MGDSENAQQPSKKRGALKQLTRETLGVDDDDETTELESGTFKKASDEVLASRRIVRIKRKEPSAAPASAPNPFAGIQLVPAIAPAPALTSVGTNPPLAETEVTPAEAVVEKAIDSGEEDEVDSKKVDVKDTAADETEKAKDEDDDQRGKTDVDQTVTGVTNISDAVEGTDQTEDPLEKDTGGDQAERKEKEGEESEEADKNGDNNGALSSFQQHSSSKNAFTGLASTEGSGSSSFSFGLVSQDGSTGSGSLFGNNSSLFGASGSSIIKKSEGSGFPPKQEVSTETGEENEKVAFSADSIMFEYLDGGWKERGKGEVKVNVSSNGGKARLVMRAKGNYRLILNASVYPEMKLAAMDKKGITFACVNSVSEGKEGLSTFALKFKDPTIVEEFRVAIEKHKDSKPTEEEAAALPLKTPENSPTATDA
uniref:Nuclear pore complex protein NUP50A n=1 Tax=Noccaea caerulescens TaxID=107243 RepID=A0A1J3DTS3_NOCCA